MLQRTVTQVRMTCWKDHHGFIVQVDTEYIESTIGSGKKRQDVERYEKLTEEECRDVIEAVSSGGLPGADYGAQLAMFAIG